MSSDGSISACVVVPLKALWAFIPIGLQTQHTHRNISAFNEVQQEEGQRSSLITTCNSL